MLHTMCENLLHNNKKKKNTEPPENDNLLLLTLSEKNELIGGIKKLYNASDKLSFSNLVVFILQDNKIWIKINMFILQSHQYNRQKTDIVLIILNILLFIIVRKICNYILEIKVNRSFQYELWFL